VALPLGLSDIAQRLESGYYRQPAAVLHDIGTIRANAVTFNAEGSPIINVAEGDPPNATKQCATLSSLIMKLSHRF